ncbi:Hypothetical_protein [Hexamita inflata]|uniref:Hypothetical_protein n=1 Tax=Hexamita inflata TaxID=28002 RepID=A0ABP1HV16_9EUKA
MSHKARIERNSIIRNLFQYFTLVRAFIQIQSQSHSAQKEIKMQQITSFTAELQLYSQLSTKQLLPSRTELCFESGVSQIFQHKRKRQTKESRTKRSRTRLVRALKCLGSNIWQFELQHTGDCSDDYKYQCSHSCIHNTAYLEWKYIIKQYYDVNVDVREITTCKQQCEQYQIIKFKMMEIDYKHINSIRVLSKDLIIIQVNSA